MTRTAFAITATAALSVGALMPSGAWADVTAQDVWAAWRAASLYMGQDVSVGTERVEGDTLVLENVARFAESGDMRITQRVEWLRLQDLGDGTVEITMSPEQRITGSTASGDGAFVMTFTFEGASILASGTPERVVNDYVIESLSLSEAGLTVDGAPAPVSIAFDVTGLRGTYIAETIAGDTGGGAAETGDADTTGKDGWNTGRNDDSKDGWNASPSDAVSAAGPKMRVSASANADSAHVEIEAADPKGEGRFHVTFDATALGGDFNGDLIGMAGAANPFDAGAGFEFAMRFGQIDSAVEISADGTDTQITSTGKDGTFEFAMAAEEVSYASTANDVAYVFSTSDLPFPDLEASMSSSALRLTMPTGKSETPRDFEMLVDFSDVAIDDRLWLMLDPLAALDHGRASLIVDVTGKARMFVDMLSDPDAVEALNGPPGEINALTVHDLRVSAAGTELTGSGDFVFDPAQTEMLDGFPQPEGRADLRLTGGNALLSNLVTMGLIPEDKVMGFRMMLAMFGVPGDQPDSVTSTIRFTPAGKILVNGLQMN